MTSMSADWLQKQQNGKDLEPPLHLDLQVLEALCFQKWLVRLMQTICAGHMLSIINNGEIFQFSWNINYTFLSLLASKM